MNNVICLRCKGFPCVCHYVDRLQSGAIDPAVVRVAQQRMQKPHEPIGGCPCPECYRVRYSSWEVSS